MISPVFEKLSTEHTAVEFYKVDIDEQNVRRVLLAVASLTIVQDVAQAVNIRVVPTFMLFKDGKEVASAKGANPQNLNVCTPTLQRW